MNEFHTISVKDTDFQFRLGQQHNAPVLKCSAINTPSCGYLGTKYFRLTNEQLAALKKMSFKDTYTLESVLESPVWGKINVKYQRCPLKESNEFYPTDYYDEEEIVFARHIVTSECGVRLQLPVDLLPLEERTGFAKFTYLLDSVRTTYCDDTYAFDPNEWEFLPRPSFAGSSRRPSGLAAIWADKNPYRKGRILPGKIEYQDGDIAGFDFKIWYQNKDLEKWCGVKLSGEKRRAPKPTQYPIKKDDPEVGSIISEL